MLASCSDPLGNVHARLRLAFIGWLNPRGTCLARYHCCWAGGFCLPLLGQLAVRFSAALCWPSIQADSSSSRSLHFSGMKAEVFLMLVVPTQSSRASTADGRRRVSNSGSWNDLCWMNTRTFFRTQTGEQAPAGWINEMSTNNLKQYVAKGTWY